MPRILLMVAAGAACAPILYGSPTLVLESQLRMKAKLFLVQELSPGTCFGMPVGSTRKDFKRSMLDRLLLGLSCHEGEPRYEYDELLRQLEMVTLAKAGELYRFTVADGSCCTARVHSGSVRVSQGAASIELSKIVQITLLAC